MFRKSKQYCACAACRNNIKELSGYAYKILLSLKSKLKIKI